MTSRFKLHTVELIFVFVAFVAVFAWFDYLEERTDIRGGIGPDAGYYLTAQSIAQGRRPTGPAPWVQRIAAPWLAARIGGTRDLLRSFLAINIAGTLLAVILLWFWLRRFLRKPWLRVLLCLLFLLQGPFRMVFVAPAGWVDPLFFAALLAAMLALERHIDSPGRPSILLLCLLSIVAVVVREAALLAPFSLLFADNPLAFPSADRGLWDALGKTVRQWLTPFRLLNLLPLLVVAAVYVGVRLWVQPTNSYSAFGVASMFAYIKGPASFLHAWMLAVGPLTVLLLYEWRENLRFLGRRQELLAFAGGVLLLAWLGGTDTVRILQWGLPVFYVLIGRVVERRGELLRSIPLLLLLLGGQLLTMRTFLATPLEAAAGASHAFPLLTPLAPGGFPYKDLLTLRGDTSYKMVLLLEHMALLSLLLLWLGLRDGRLRRGESPSAG